ncbi:glutamate synthase [Burkholderia oklahomensis EO147]|uniref:Glutamate synthase n=1 Tax=Burkholderia oklahomensis EO147 TaxID=441163 RepID=A0AAC9DBQ6_9BURK|nr:glutamate synthase [Burkholderia oklahomensis EO147]AOI44644.1 glutamate synthase [Burkholderia oklahomensis C6786]KUY58060.1 glutamate synthase [Burkholderia oklahomensis C6786]KUY66683.1 glutamate synthase [Burkholderia oklahomensis EO147]
MTGFADAYKMKFLQRKMKGWALRAARVDEAVASRAIPAPCPRPDDRA